MEQSGRGVGPRPDLLFGGGDILFVAVRDARQKPPMDGTDISRCVCAKRIPPGFDKLLFTAMMSRKPRWAR